MYDLMVGLSQEYFAASWMSGTEYQLWRLATEGGTWGNLQAEMASATLNRLLQLAGERGQWMRWSAGPYPIDLDEWRVAYRSWRSQMQPEDE